MTSGSLWNYYRNGVNDDANKNNDAGNYRIDNNKTTTSKPSEYKTKIIGSVPDKNSRLDAEVVVPLKYLSNVWKFLNLPLINCETEIDLTWSRNCIMSGISRTAAVAGNPNAFSLVLAMQATLTTGATFQMINAKVDGPVVILCINNNTKFLEHLKEGFRRTVFCNRYTFERTTHPKRKTISIV